MKLGAHLSIAGGVDKAVDRAEELEINAFQIFAKNPRGWTGKELTTEVAELFKEKSKSIELASSVVHANYLSNLATPKDELYKKSKESLTEDIRRADCLGADYVVLHPGNHTGSGIEAGIKRVNQALQEIINEFNPEAKLLLENVAGAGTEVGFNFDDLLAMTEGIPLKRVGICLDTCHAFTAGYDLRSEAGFDGLLTEIDDTFGLENLPVIHVNDSKEEVGSNKDRHYHIGQGKIGSEGFARLVNHSQMKEKVLIIETPIDDNGDDELNLKTLRNLGK
ncbi:deoxyribonuclease IV [Acetohalobium arabaticum]|uniref:Probable endonuclease 4 n=1 Tax=Acetohalobium arabaticum (strain ATCC 49924 / DSM 5501 / Z-7288) TaxID=574087 RepID=D9QRF5_ACEAZ|nr:deoxyribonuclease IV [Acetohalobium arabaticum]ADL13096.1 apurinic endonuclease Apn1 [Acetohalobium arabaticum DSM 5501]